MICTFALVEKCFRSCKFVVNSHCKQNIPCNPSHPAALKGSGEGSTAAEQAAAPQHRQSSLNRDLKSKGKWATATCVLSPRPPLSPPWQNYLGGHLDCGNSPQIKASLGLFPDLTPSGSRADSTVRKELGAEVQALAPTLPTVSGEHGKDAKDSGLPSLSPRHWS